MESPQGLAVPRPKLNSRSSSRGCVHDSPFVSQQNQAAAPTAASTSSAAPVDVAIVGGGACGLAVIIHLVERMRKGKQLRSIVLIEKRNIIGPGLPYSQACKATRLNMYTNTMGLYANDPYHFRDWVFGSDLALDSFHSRELYGEYLKELFAVAIKDCQSLGVAFEGMKNEVVDIQKIGERHELVLANDSKVQAKEVVLALGNFCMTIHKHLSPNDKYFRCPWPAEKLKSIPPHASVFVVGSRLSAVDVAIVLAEHGHEGPITFVSRSGKLPKVQAAVETFSRKYALYSLAKEVEDFKSPEGGALSKILSRIGEEIGSGSMAEVLALQSTEGPLETLRKDITEAEKGVVHWQTVIRATPNLVERYWNCCTLSEKETFLNTYNSLWVTYRHAIPLENARKILALLETGQLRVVKGEPARWNGVDFVIQTEGGEIQSEYIIEALGQEYDTANIESPFLQRLLASGTLVAHPSGGVEVDFATSKASSGIHVIGSLTRGVHFYTSAIDRIAAHASRIADSIVDMPVRRSLHIAFFIGSDLFTHLMLSKLIPQLLLEGHMPFIFQPSDNVNKNNQKKPPQPFALQELSFFERQLLQNYVIPFLGSSVADGATSMTVEQMKAHFGIMVEKIESVNKFTFLQTLEEHHIDIGFSLRCYQRFGPRIIKHFSTPPRALLNLHPGILPQYRGVVTAIRSMMHGDKEFGYSLHHIDENFDSGDVVDIRKNAIDYGKSVMEGMEDHYEIGGQMVLDTTERFARGCDLHKEKVEQDEGKAAYYGFLSEAELQTCSGRGLRIVEGGKVKELLVRYFAGNGEKEALRRVLDKAVDDWYEKFRANERP